MKLRAVKRLNQIGTENLYQPHIFPEHEPLRFGGGEHKLNGNTTFIKH